MTCLLTLRHKFEHSAEVQSYGYSIKNLKSQDELLLQELLEELTLPSEICRFDHSMLNGAKRA